MSQPHRPAPDPHLPEAHASGHGPGEHPAPRPISGRAAVLALLILVVCFVIAAVGGILPRVHARKTLAAQTNALAAPDVTVVHPVAASPNSEIVLPGNTYAYTDAPIYARTPGYLEHWYFDIGAHVKKGQLLAVISTPEVDQQLIQARADLATAEANAGYAKQTAKRYQDLLTQDAVSRQDTENFSTQAIASNTTVKSALANVQRLEALQSFEKVYAPFNGIIASRGIDIGQLINAGAANSGGASELFHMQATDTLRIYVNVPQIYSRDAVPGTRAQLAFSEYPGRLFTGTLVRTARSIDQASRTLLAEVDVDNRKGELVPGAYAEVHMRVNRNVPVVTIPVSALLFRREGLRVATVVHTPDGDVARLQRITLGHDDGQTVQVLNGLDSSSLVVQDPPDSIIDNEPVRIVQPHPDQNIPGMNSGAGNAPASGNAPGQPGGRGDNGGQGNPGVGKEKGRS
jgi:RND family efflux transporter MFP subunit